MGAARKRPPVWAVWGLLPLAFGGGWYVHQWLGLELSLDSLRDWVRGQGTIAPFVYLGVLTFRQFLFLPSILLVTVGGLCFGVLWGTVLGSLGLFFSGVITFALGRGLGADWMRAKLGARYPGLDEKIEKFGPWVVFASMVYPAGPMTGVFWASGISTIRFGAFALAVAVGGIIRAFTYSFFGASLIDGLTPRFYLGAGLLTLLLVGPILVPSLRRRLGEFFS
ncbi:MAG: VTT domain-containing protein [Deltaproteobacteria bacterium]